MFHVKQYTFSGFGLGDYNDYIPVNLLENFSINELRHEYARLRKIANKNIAELKESRYAEQEFVQRVEAGFGYKSTMSKRELAYQVAKVAQFHASPRSTVAGFEQYERNLQEKLSAATGIDVPLEDVLDLRDFMQELREKGVFKEYDSETAVSWFEEYSEKHEDTSDAAERFLSRFRTWQQKREAAMAAGRKYNRKIRV